VIGHLKSDHRMDRNYLALRIGDAVNPVLAAVGYNFRRLLKRLAFWLAWNTASCLPDAATANQLQNA
jgi:IS5 family transposase